MNVTNVKVNDEKVELLTIKKCDYILAYQANLTADQHSKVEFFLTELNKNGISISSPLESNENPIVFRQLRLKDEMLGRYCNKLQISLPLKGI